MTNEEENVIKMACNLTDSIIAGDYHLPREMTYSINMLQDAVYDYLNKSGKNLSDLTTPEYVELKDKARKERWGDLA